MLAKCHRRSRLRGAVAPLPGERPPFGPLTRFARARKHRGIITASRRSTAGNRPGRRSWRYLPKIARFLTALPRPSPSRCRGRYRTVRPETAISCFAAKVPRNRPRRIRGENARSAAKEKNSRRGGRDTEKTFDFAPANALSSPTSSTTRRCRESANCEICAVRGYNNNTMHT